MLVAGMHVRGHDVRDGLWHDCALAPGHYQVPPTWGLGWEWRGLQVLEALVSSGMLSVLLAYSTSTQVFRQMVTGHALETLIDTNVLPALLGAGSMERCHGAGCGDQQGLSIRSYSLTFIIHITVWELSK